MRSSFYHGLIAGLLAGERLLQSGIEPRDGHGQERSYTVPAGQGTECGDTGAKGMPRDGDADEAAERALRQIEERGYDAEARELGYRNIIKYGVAFRGKVCYAEVKTDGR